MLLLLGTSLSTISLFQGGKIWVEIKASAEDVRIVLDGLVWLSKIGCYHTRVERPSGYGLFFRLYTAQLWKAVKNCPPGIV